MISISLPVTMDDFIITIIDYYDYYYYYTVVRLLTLTLIPQDILNIFYTINICNIDTITYVNDILR